MQSDYLKHHGVLGMHWGVRRYQNKDGSLTPAGKKRYGSDGNRTEKQVRNRLNDLKYALGLHTVEKKYAIDPKRIGWHETEIERGYREINKILKDAKKQGITIKDANKHYSEEAVDKFIKRSILFGGSDYAYQNNQRQNQQIVQQNINQWHMDTALQNQMIANQMLMNHLY